MYITYNNEKLAVIELFPGNSDIVVDAEGIPYLKTWIKPKIKPQTPGTRKKMRWSPQQIKYVQYPKGVLSLYRGLRASVSTGTGNILSHQAWCAIIEEFQKNISAMELGKIEKDESVFSLLQPIKREISVKRAQEMIEAQSTLAHLVKFEDASGKINFGVILTRSTAVSERIIERIKGVYAWKGRNTKLALRLKIEEKKFIDFLTKIKKLATEINASQNPRPISNKHGVAHFFRVIENDFANLSVRMGNIEPYATMITTLDRAFHALQKANRQKDVYTSSALIDVIASIAYFYILNFRVHTILIEYTETNDVHGIRKQIDGVISAITYNGRLTKIPGSPTIQEFRKLKADLITLRKELLTNPKAKSNLPI